MAVRRAHAAHFLALAEEAEPLLRARDQVHWMARLTPEQDDMLAALRWAIDGGEGGCAGTGWKESSGRRRLLPPAVFGYLGAAECDLVEARERHARALEPAAESRDRSVIGYCLVEHAGLAVLDGDPERAATLLGAAHAARGGPCPGEFDVARVGAAARTVLGEEDFANAYEHGRAMPFDDVLAWVRGAGQARRR